jgi:drug/metabolite transporter (DMT)-like permease
MTAQPATRQRPRDLKASIGVVGAAFIWGSMVPLTALALTTLDTFFLAAVRYSVALPALGAIAWLADRRFPLHRHLPWRQIIPLGAIGMGLFVICFTLGIHYSDPITVAALISGAPIVSAVAMRVLEGERLAARLPFAILLAVGGGLMVALGKPESTASQGFRGGELLVLTAMLVWAWYSVKSQAWLALRAGMSQPAISFLTALAAALFLWIVFLVGQAAGFAQAPSQPLSLPIWLNILWLGIACTGMATLLWNYGVSRLGVTVATLQLNLEPVFAVLVGVALGAAAGWLQILGGLVVLAGVIWVQMAPRTR